MRFHVQNKQPALSFMAGISWKDADPFGVGGRDYDQRMAIGDPLRDFLADGAPPRTGVWYFLNQTTVRTA